MNDLVRTIINRNFIDANGLFEERLDNIIEHKLLEKKRQLAEANGPDGKWLYNNKADWAKYRKQNPARGFHQDAKGNEVPKTKGETKIGGGLTKQAIQDRKDSGYIKADTYLKAKEFIRRVRKYKETGKINEEERADLKAKVANRQRSDAEDVAAINKAKNTQEPPRDATNMSVSRKSIKNNNSGSLRSNALKSLMRQNASDDANSWAERRMQKHIDHKTVKSLKNIVKGQNIGANARNLVKYGRKSTAAKAAGAAWNGWGNIVSAGMRGPLEENRATRRIRVRAIKKDK